MSTLEDKGETLAQEPEEVMLVSKDNYKGKHVQPQHAAACRSIQFFELAACSSSVCTGDILPAPCLPSLFLFVVMSQSSAPKTSSQQSTPSTPLLFSLSDDHALLAMLSERSV